MRWYACRPLMLITVIKGHASAHVAEKPLGLNFSCSGIVASPFKTGCRATVPNLECISIVLAHLFLGCEAVRELLEHEVRVHGGDAADQDNQHPFHY